MDSSLSPPYSPTASVISLQCTAVIINYKLQVVWYGSFIIFSCFLIIAVSVIGARVANDRAHQYSGRYSE